MGKGAEGPTCISIVAQSTCKMEIHEEPLSKKVEEQVEMLTPAEPAEVVAPTEGSAEVPKDADGEDVCYDNPVYENGGTQECVVVKGSSSEGPEPERTEDAASKRRLYFVRMPKPPETNPAIAAIQQEHEHLKMQMKLLDVNLTVKRSDKNRQHEQVVAAQQEVAKKKAQLDAVDEKLKPLLDLSKKKKADQEHLRTTFGDLEVRSETELKEKLKQLQFRCNHETNSLAEERMLLKQIKRLEGLGDRVKEYEKVSAAFASSREEISKHEDELKALKAERSLAYDDLVVQRSLVRTLKDGEQALEADIQSVRSEKARIKDLADAAYQKLFYARNEHKAKNDSFYENRRFGTKIRDLCKSGKVDVARAMCEEQMKVMNEKLANDAEFRKQYIAMWEQQRPYAVYSSPAELEDSHNLAVNGVAKVEPVDPSGKQPRLPPTEEVKAKAQAVIDAALNAAKVELVPANKIPDAVAVEPAIESADAVVPPVVQVAQEKKSKESPEKKVKKEKPKTRLPPAVIPDVEFVLPEVISKGPATETNAENKKALERQRQLALAKEAEAKKERKRKAVEKKKQRALEKPDVQVAPPPALPELVEVAPRHIEEPVAPPAPKREVSKPSTLKVQSKGLKPRPSKKKDMWSLVKHYRVWILVAMFAVLLIAAGMWLWLSQKSAVITA